MTQLTDRYKVVINHEEQYSIVPANQILSRGYREAGIKGSKDYCLKYIENVRSGVKQSDEDTSIRSRKG